MAQVQYAVYGRRALLSMICGLLLCVAGPAQSSDEGELQIALTLADVLRAARSEIAGLQGQINDPLVGDKGLSGETILANVLKRVESINIAESIAAEPDSLQSRLLQAQMDSIREIAEENQPLINKKGVAFKGFVPAVFAQLVNERFGEKVGDEAEMKVTAPMNLVRNRKARPDKWERSVIEDKFSTAEWPRGQLYSANAEDSGGDAFRVMVPEYYGEACLACHGSPAGDLDITGHPKEGGAFGDLGGSISITLYQ